MNVKSKGSSQLDEQYIQSSTKSISGILTDQITIRKDSWLRSRSHKLPFTARTYGDALVLSSV